MLDVLIEQMRWDERERDRGFVAVELVLEVFAVLPRDFARTFVPLPMGTGRSTISVRRGSTQDDQPHDQSDHGEKYRSAETTGDNRQNASVVTIH